MEGIFDGLDQQQPPISSEEFKKQIVQRYAEEAESVGIDACVGEAVDQVWPAPGYREHQREAVIDILKGLYVEDDTVVTLSAPTGAGKSLILHGVMATLHNEFGRRAFFTTPLNALIDQVDDDEFIADETVTLKGKNNYSCVHQHDAGTSVDNAICQRTDDFDCQHKNVPHTEGGCPYYGRRTVAQSHPEVVTNLSYLMANSMIPDDIDAKFDPRELLVIDECQSIEDFALQFVSVVVSKGVVPEEIIDRVQAPPKTDDAERLCEWLQEHVMPPVQSKLAEFDAKAELTEAEADIRDDLTEFERKVRNLVYDIKEHHWVATRETEDDSWRVEFKPIFIGRFLDSFLWEQGHKVVLSSATIPKSGFLEEVGLDDRDVSRVEVPSTFPPERRPVITEHEVGKMTYNERDSTIPKMAEKIAEMANHHEGERGFVHCRAYSIMERIYEHLPTDVKQRTRCQDPDRREESLEEWLDSDIEERSWGEEDGGQVFLSVAMAEGISLDDWRARWQVIAKAAYPNMRNDRVDYRLNELDDWNWYASSAAIDLQQAVGRGMRSKDDHCITYVLDKSAATLIERNEHLFEDWFLDAVDGEWFKDET
jgi:Rad3-related DNA helicase